MIEAGVVISRAGKPIFWHLPPNRSAVSIPDTRVLWDVLWEHRANLSGFAHSHPGSGIPRPSHTDLGTFLAIEEALGQGLRWWITSADKLVECRRTEKSSFRFTKHLMSTEPSWAAELRRISNASTSSL